MKKKNIIPIYMISYFLFLIFSYFLFLIIIVEFDEQVVEFLLRQTSMLCSNRRVMAY